MLRSWKLLAALISTTLLLTFLPGRSVDAQTTEAQNPSLREVEEAIDRAQEHVLALQNENGHWGGDCIFHIASDPDLMGTTGFYVYLLSHMGTNNPNIVIAVCVALLGLCIVMAVRRNPSQPFDND